mmetsp:Transcript_12028/g.18328  ORF Transcript_12028/g.18328 Transcript_12028/m.18328 type:complete len:96 (+) Transcript_12028:1116-1403(+)
MTECILSTRRNITSWHTNVRMENDDCCKMSLKVSPLKSPVIGRARKAQRMLTVRRKHIRRHHRPNRSFGGSGSVNAHRNNVNHNSAMNDAGKMSI